ncbi:MAG TPA: adenylyltransferase/cytidyltransferase family protein [Bryobacteraceae bacterium]|jgi:D-beta-D-heptose 7-phosphate kinase/D-beta-D-heptose 1-phosphate adenosyltransferase|nr:adenylyltransferase/cytidyltransferase family protein [Bryobacteraceae bacterium]
MPDVSGTKVRVLDDLIASRADWSRESKTVVWTNGCFDLLHVGHIRNFRDAKALGDVLIVGINSDSSVRAIKGDSRPIVPQEERAELIAALEMVDYVTIFDEPTPAAALSRLRPDIHCKGAEYADGSRPMPERETVLSYGGQIRFLPFHPGRSTTELMDRIVKSAEAACLK